MDRLWHRVSREGHRPQEPPSSPGDIQKDDALRFQVLNLGG